MRGGRPGKPGEKAGGQAIEKPEKTTERSFKKRAGAAETDERRATRKNGEKGEAENRERKNEMRKNREREKSEADFQK